jgi:hypothetical protein
MSFLRRLKEYDSVEALQLNWYNNQIIERELLVEGNALLSTVFISALTFGSSVLVEWYDDTTGHEEGEVYPLASHPLLLAPLTTHRLTVTRLHNKPKLRVTVIGTARFSIYVTVISSMATDLDAALELDGNDIDYIRDKGLPIVVKENSTDKWHFLSTEQGKLKVTLGDELSFQPPNVTLSKVTVAIPDQENEDIIHTVTKDTTLLAGKGYSTSWAEWSLLINGVEHSYNRNNQVQPSVDIVPSCGLKLQVGDILKIVTKNVTIYGENSSIKTFLYGVEHDG